MVRSWSRNSTGPRSASPSPVVQICSVRPAALAGVTGRHGRGDPAPRVGSGVGHRSHQLWCGHTRWSEANDHQSCCSHPVRSLENPCVRHVKRRFLCRCGRLSRSTTLVLPVELTGAGAQRAATASGVPQTPRGLTCTLRPPSRRLTTGAYRRLGGGRRRGVGEAPRLPWRWGCYHAP
jgi:hypothetical protein